MAQSKEATVPNYGILEPSSDTVILNLSIRGVKPAPKLTFFKNSSEAANGDILIDFKEKEFRFEFIGRNELANKRYRLRLCDLPGDLNTGRCKYKVIKDSVLIVLKKKDSSRAWLSDISSLDPVDDD
ncbi:hypothetical protein FBUS_07088 [Fasciolopsis buskii]|uniref:CS domain-containing protein n=1 Tax=Fasciolopsis buskii TaxID=27845 RepID=A0A8E0RPK3_9TREM|nr:hypothetical protein FBUS_07088 [Fasciolopsis buski]